MLAPGHEVDRYVVDCLLGEGGTAVVYRVRHRTLGTLHALKVPTASSKSMLMRLVGEGKAQATLIHPNLVRVTDVLNVEGLPGLLMEYVDGSNLLDLIQRGPLPPAEAERLFRAILSGVAFAHRQGFIHRDLKPANVLLTAGPDGPVPKITDFGLAKEWMEEDRGHTRTGSMMGTPGYMSPEQIQNAKAVDPRTDLFAMGAILYEMLIGKPAFTGNTLAQIFMAVQTGSYRSPEQVAPQLPDHLVNAIRACLVVERDRRVASAEDLFDILDRRRGWAPIAVSPETLQDADSISALPEKKPARRGLALPLLLFVAVALGLYSAAPSKPAAPPQPAPQNVAPTTGPPVEPLEIAAPTELLPAPTKPSPGPTPILHPEKPAIVKVVDEKPSIPVELPTKKPGKLTVNSRPEGRYEVLGGPSADTWNPVSVPAGSHQVIVTCKNSRCEGKKSRTLTVEVTEEGSTVICWDFDLQNSCR